jgi:hypothetical protein
VKADGTRSCGMAGTCIATRGREKGGTTVKQQTVYRFEVWDLSTRTKSFVPQMGTPEAIRRLKGEADLESAKQVSAEDLDETGLYWKDIS